MTLGAELLGASRVYRRRMRRERIRMFKRAWRSRRKRVEYTPPDVDFTLSGPQLDVFSSDRRFRTLIAGRRFGKTYLACVELICAALEHPGGLVWYVGPTYSQAKDIAWEMLKSLLPPEWVRSFNESTLTARLVNKARIVLKGAEHPNRLRGRGLVFCVFDEFPLIRKAAWEEAVRPALSVSEGGALFIGTPMGFNWAYDHYQLGTEGYVPPKDSELTAADLAQYRSWTFTTAQGGRVSKKELRLARIFMDPRLYRQEYHASFEALSGRVFSTFESEVHKTPIAEDDESKTLYVGMDFNVNPMTAVLGVDATTPEHLTAGTGPILHIFDTIVLPDANTELMAEAIRKRWPAQVPDPDRPGKKKPGRKIVVCPDPSGKRRSTSAGAGVTDHIILQRAGFVVLAEPSAPLVKDSVNNARALLRSADGKVRCFVHPRCTPLIAAFNGLIWVNNEPDKKSSHIHIADAFRYLAWQKFNVLNPVQWGTSSFKL